MKSMRLLQILSLAIPASAEAHPFHWATNSIGFMAGLTHPITSSDHILTMLVVGLWLSQTGRRVFYFTPLVFVILIIIGGSLTFFPSEIAHAENVLHLSVLILGLLLASGYKASPLIGTLIAGNLALFYGYIHVFDMLLDTDAIAFTTGFALATVLLIYVGFVIKQLFNRFKNKLLPEMIQQ